MIFALIFVLLLAAAVAKMVYDHQKVKHKLDQDESEGIDIEIE